MSLDLYGSQLQTITDILQRAGFTASIRGGGAARFVYVEHGARAAELSQDVIGFVVELFEEPDDSPVRGCQLSTPELAAETALEWFSPKRRDT